MNAVPPCPTSSCQVVVVGGGPIGIETAVACRNAGLDAQVIEAGVIGQTMSWWAPGTRWFSSNERIAIAGVPLLTPDQTKATREQYLTYLRSVVQQFELDVRCRQRVASVQRDGDGLTVLVQTPAGPRQIHCGQVVLAVGGTDHPRRLGIDGEDLPHVDGYLREVHQYFGRRVLIVGGRNSAIEAALRLYHVGADVTLSYRGPSLPSTSIKYWLRPEIEGLIRAGRITAHFSTVPLRITSSQVELAAVDPESGDIDRASPTIVPADDVLTLIGYEQDKTLFREIGIELVHPGDHPAYDAETMMTSVPGVYVAGTAVAGTQSSRYKVFLENCHEHVDKIVRHITGRSVAVSQNSSIDSIIRAQPES
ncbi:Ferredoxin--NADP reductase 2 [Crateriforma conspicua]|uniref:Ferredoxin--NADP reductase 2 n=1 Tax=Crateriforma conspicua TaxID=2527996 RepID=A0A5C6FQJ1_9PLAN|nr:Ferredoxin--NADP reductase 2 [Crateriforma conspicua]